MNERRPNFPHAVLASVALLTLVTLAALYAPRFASPAAKPKAAPPPRASVLPIVQVWLSTADRRLRLQRQPDVDMTARSTSSPDDVVIDPQKRFQTMVGFGAAMTDSSAWLIQNKLGFFQRRALLHELYGPPPNLGLNMMRLTIGASDFSLKPYTLDDVPFGQVDPQLQHFNVTPNVHDVIPTVRAVLAINPELVIIASPWSAPAWMKTSQNLIGGELLPQYESAYADYLVKYLDAYLGYGIPIFALTLQNEPSFVPITYPGMEMPADTRARIIAQYLGPKLASRTQKTQILEWDHNWNAPEQPLSVLASDAGRYVNGVAWHCYDGSQYAQGRVHRAYPQKDAYLTECSGGDWASAVNGELLWFTRELLVTGTRQWARGVVYWNLVLDEKHGPHFGGCALCKGVVTIDSKTGDVSRNDEYYAFAHFSRFVLPGAVRVESTKTDEAHLANVAFQNASDDSIVVVMVNSDAVARPVTVVQGQTRFQYTLPPQSVATFVWNPDQANAWVRRVSGWFTRVRQGVQTVPGH